MLQNGGRTPAVRIQLHIWPRGVLRIAGFVDSGVFCLNTDEAGVAASKSLPFPCSGMIRTTSRNDVKRSIPAQAKLRKRARQVGTSILKDGKTGHIPTLGPRGMVTDYALDFAGIAAAAVWPAVNFGDLETGVLEYCSQPGQFEWHVRLLLHQRRADLHPVSHLCLR